MCDKRACHWINRSPLAAKTRVLGSDFAIFVIGLLNERNDGFRGSDSDVPSTVHGIKCTLLATMNHSLDMMNGSWDNCQELSYRCAKSDRGSGPAITRAQVGQAAPPLKMESGRRSGPLFRFSFFVRRLLNEGKEGRRGATQRQSHLWRIELRLFLDKFWTVHGIIPLATG